MMDQPFTIGSASDGSVPSLILHLPASPSDAGAMWAMIALVLLALSLAQMIVFHLQTARWAALAHRSLDALDQDLDRRHERALDDGDAGEEARSQADAFARDDGVGP